MVIGGMMSRVPGVQARLWYRLWYAVLFPRKGS